MGGSAFEKALCLFTNPSVSGCNKRINACRLVLQISKLGFKNASEPYHSVGNGVKKVMLIITV